jgi:hypothetical protein
MRGKITKIHEPQTSRLEHTFIRIEFLMEDGSWAKTDVVPSYRNYRFWKMFIETGSHSFVENLEYRAKGEIDADCRPQVCEPFDIIKHRNVVGATQERLI